MLTDLKKLREKKEALAKEAKGASVASLILKGRIRYENGDYEQAEELFRKAAEAGSAEAALFLGRLLYLDTYDVFGDRECLRWLKQAEAAGYEEAQQLLVDLYCELDSPEEAERCYQLAPENIDAMALDRLGRCYLGKETRAYEKHYSWQDDDDSEIYSRAQRQRDLDRAYEFFLRAAGKGCQEAELDLGEVFSDRDFSGRDLAKAMAYYLKAGQNGYAEGFSRAARLKKDSGELKSAEELYLKAAKGGSAEAMLDLARLLETYGDGSRQKEATGWYLRAAYLGDGTALYEAALRLMLGVGVKRDVEKGVKCLDEATGQGYGCCYAYRDELEEIAARLGTEESAPLLLFLASLPEEDQDLDF